MKATSSEKTLRDQVRRWRQQRLTVGFVPTMGALHAGHMKLVEEARAKSDRVVVSIYVNPTQFGPREDLSRYPRPVQKDHLICKKNKVDFLFRPLNLYAKDASTFVCEETLSRGRCGDSRPGHFRGVATVVVKLLSLVQPDFIWMGWKDAQQVQVIQQVVRDLSIPVEVIPVETVRDQDGLALSSRNIYLSLSERQTALAIPLLLRLAVLQKNPEQWYRIQIRKISGIRLDYVELVQGRLCVAAWVGKTRLIDNMKVLKR